MRSALEIVDYAVEATVWIALDVVRMEWGQYWRLEGWSGDNVQGLVGDILRALSSTPA